MEEQNAQYLADVANAAEAAILTELSSEMLDFYMNLPRETRVEIVMNAAKETIKNLKNS